MLLAVLTALAAPAAASAHARGDRARVFTHQCGDSLPVFATAVAGRSESVPAKSDDSDALRSPALLRLPVGATKPAGWLRDELQLQAKGISGQLPMFWPFSLILPRSRLSSAAIRPLSPTYLDLGRSISAGGEQLPGIAIDSLLSRKFLSGVKNDSAC